MGNKNVVIGLILILLFLSISFFIERTSSRHGFHSKAATVVIDTKNSPDLLKHEVTDVRMGPAYRTGGIYFTNSYPASYVPVPNNFRETAYGMRLYGWLYALFGIAVGFIVGSAASWLAVVGALVYPIRDTVGFWGRWFDPNYSFGWAGPIVYPLKWLGGAAMVLALLLALVVFVQGSRQAPVRARK
jgi:hypothetical protein